MSARATNRLPQLKPNRAALTRPILLQRQWVAPATAQPNPDESQARSLPALGEKLLPATKAHHHFPSSPGQIEPKRRRAQR